MKKLTKLPLILSILITGGFAAEYTAQFSHVVAPETTKGKAALFFAKRVGELSDGKIEVIVTPSAKLYDDDAVFAALKMGKVQFAAPSLSKFASVPQIQLFDLPFIFRDSVHLHKVLDGEVGVKIKNDISAKGFIALNYWDAGFKNMSSNKKAIVATEDAKGQKFRIMPSAVLEEQTKTLGAAPISLPFGEVYNALKEGIVDASENPLSNFIGSKLYEVQNSITITEHGYLGYMVIASEKWFKTLPIELQNTIKQASNEATEFERSETIKAEKELLGKLEIMAKEGKIKLTVLTPEQKKMWSKNMSAIYPKFFDSIGQELIEKAQK